MGEELKPIPGMGHGLEERRCARCGSFRSRAEIDGRKCEFCEQQEALTSYEAENTRLRAALEGLVEAAEPLLAETRTFDRDETLLIRKMPMRPGETDVARGALQTARAALSGHVKEGDS